jgi:glycosyltransferase involved in cell wall biosynthesis
MSKPRALFVGANAEEYGSDRMFLHSIDALGDVVEPVVLLPRSGPLVDRLAARDIQTIVCGDYALRRSRASARGVASLLVENAVALGCSMRLHHERPFALVYSNTQTVVVGAVMARALRARHVWHIHEIVGEPSSLARPLAELVARSGGSIIACSRSVERSLVGLAPRAAGRVHIVPNGIDLAPAPLPYRPADELVRIGCVGRLHVRKGQDLLLRAVGLLERRAPHVGKRLEVHLFGSPFPGHEPVVDDIRSVARDEGLGERVVFHGFVSHPAAIYPNIDVLVLPSVEPESFGLVCLEAMAFGRPVIAPAEGGPAELLRPRRTGVLFRPRDASSLAEALESIVEDPSSARVMAGDARRAVEDWYTLPRYRREIRDVVMRTCDVREVTP